MKNEHEKKVWYALLAAILNDQLTVNNAIVAMRIAEIKEFRNRRKKAACVTAQAAH